MKNIVSFSGGKDSTAMLLMMIEKGMPIDKIICVDTTKEFPQMYEHIQKVQKMIEPLKIEIVKIDFDYWFGEHIKTRGKRKGEKGYGFPDFRVRWCTFQKRDEKIKFYKEHELTKDNIIEYVGIAFDEQNRQVIKSKNDGYKKRYPLIDWQITEQQALEYCYSKGLDWGGLYEKFYRVSCWCCPLSRIGELNTLYTEFPELWQELKEMNKKSFRKFRSDYSVKELEIKFEDRKKDKHLEFAK